jgi:pilus assembly protein CpaF
VGDFVLRFEAAPGTVLAPESTASAAGPRDATASELGTGSAQPPRDGVSHYPLENDPDEPGPGRAPMVPSAPRVPTGFSASKGPSGTALLGAIPQPEIAVQSSPVPAAPQRPSHAAQAPVVPTPPPQPTPALPSPTPGAPAPPPTPLQRTSVPDVRPREPSRAQKDSSVHAAHRLALATLVDRIGEMIDLAPLADGQAPDEALLARVERAIREQVVSLKDDGEIPADIDRDALSRDAHRELIGLGPIGPLLDDEEVVEIHATRHDQVVAARGAQMIPIEPPFTSDDALRRVILRLCALGGHPIAAGEMVVERPLARGGLLTAVLPPLAQHGHMLAIRKRRRAEAVSEDLVRSGTVSRAMWTFLSQCVTARLNVLVAAPRGVGASSLVGSLLTAVGDGDRVIVLQSPEDAPIAHSHAAVISLDDPSKAEAVVRAASRMRAERLVLGSLGGPSVGAALEAIGDGRQGVLAVARAPSLRHAFARLAPEICATRPGLSPEAAREWLASSFDVGIELARLRDGRLRVIRVAEIAGVEAGAVGLRDVFQFAVERAAAGGALEGTFSATGAVPRFVEDLRLRGISLDPGLFDRGSMRASS